MGVEGCGWESGAGVVPVCAACAARVHSAVGVVDEVKQKVPVTRSIWRSVSPRDPVMKPAR